MTSLVSAQSVLRPARAHPAGCPCQGPALAAGNPLLGVGGMFYGLVCPLGSLMYPGVCPHPSIQGGGRTPGWWLGRLVPTGVSQPSLPTLPAGRALTLAKKTSASGNPVMAVILSWLVVQVSLVAMLLSQPGQVKVGWHLGWVLRHLAVPLPLGTHPTLGVLWLCLPTPSP